MHEHQIPQKANRILNLFLIGLLLVLMRVWYLSVIQHDEKLKESRRPQRRSVIEQVERATIRDRFNLPLATNQIQYHAAIRYAEIREIPSIIWKKDSEGKSYRFHARLHYITELAQFLSKELGMNSLTIEDTIHGKASLFPHTPFVIKKDLTEREYYRLKMLEREWLGVEAQRSSKRVYPQGKVGSDIVGYLGPINQREHHKIAQEISTLQEYLSLREKGELPFLPKGFTTPLTVRKRLRELQEKAYTINDWVGKAGIEGQFDEQLRGLSGKKTYEVDTKGNFLHELPGTRNPIPGERVVLTISSELQAFAEALLGHYEERKKHKKPWIKGGAIVAMDPKTGELLALATYPRLNPNDFIEKNTSQILRWMENQTYVGEIWDGKLPMERECYSFKEHTFYEEQEPLTWGRYLEEILADSSAVKQALGQIGNLQALYHFLEATEESLEIDLLHNVPIEQDKLLVVDLCRLIVKKEDLTPSLIERIGDQTIEEFRFYTQVVARLKASLKKEIKEIFYDIDFLPWREENFKEFLSQKRKEEKERKQYARPYTDYLDAAFAEQFSSFWDTRQLPLLKALILNYPEGEIAPYFEALEKKKWPELEALRAVLIKLGPFADDYLKAFRSFEDLSRPLLGKYRQLPHLKGKQIEKHLAAAFYPSLGFGYGRSQAYRQSSPQGSIFKLVTAYEALKERYEATGGNQLNPLTITDEMRAGGKLLGYLENGEKITRMYKGGKLPRSHHNIGKIDLIGALEQSSNVYFSLLAGEEISHPQHLNAAARSFGFGERSGVDLPGEIAGVLPHDISYNKTGLYSFAIGQHSLVVTPLQTALMLATIANGGDVLRPKVVGLVAGKERSEASFFTKDPFTLQEDLSLVGVHFPLFSETEKNREKAKVSITPTEVKRSIFFPPEIQSLLLEGMGRVVRGTRGTARPGALRGLYQEPHFLKDYIDLKEDLVGKTGTAEIFYKPTLDAESNPFIQNHVWFGGISFPQKVEESDLVVVVYLRFGDAGKEAAPLAAQMVKKWREIRARSADTEKTQ